MSLPLLPRRPGRPGRPAPVLLVLLVLAVLAPVLALTGGADAATGSDDFRAGETYRGDFPDPSVLRVGSTYYAYATNTGGKLLPTMTSPDLQTWTARPSNTPDWWDNDAMGTPPAWARRHDGSGGWRVTTWAPSVRAVRGGYVAAYVAPVSLKPLKMCVSMAYADSPLGPFVDRSTAPFVCAPDQGTIDPYVYRTAAGRTYLIWKNEGIPHHEPTRMWVRRMNRSATAFLPRARAHLLLTTALPWEGNVIENPAMLDYGGRTYLFYSANRYSTAQYAVGYAVCSSPLGPCVRPARRPLLATGGAVSGPGGPDAFTDVAGRLRLAYAAWDRGRVGYPTSAACKQSAAGCNQRRLHTATLSVRADGTLAVAARG